MRHPLIERFQDVLNDQFTPMYRCICHYDCIFEDGEHRLVCMSSSNVQVVKVWQIECWIGDCEFGIRSLGMCHPRPQHFLDQTRH